MKPMSAIKTSNINRFTSKVSRCWCPANLFIVFWAPTARGKFYSIPRFFTNLIEPKEKIAAYITETTATISWTTNKPATSNIEYGPDTNYGYSFPSPSDTTSDKISHSLALSNLSPDTTYYFNVKSKDVAGNEAVSGDYDFTTNTTIDTTTPVISDVTTSGITCFSEHSFEICISVFELPTTDLNDTPPYCLNCDSPLLKSRYRR